MKPLSRAIYLIATATFLTLFGCASNKDPYVDDQEYSNMPWSTPQQWEAAPSVPGLSGPGY